jgi:peroxiredoxin
MPVHVGDPAPDFALPPAPGPDTIRLLSFRGDRNVVVLFFPLAFSPVCTDEMCTVAEGYAGWTELNAEVVGVSVDSPFVVRKFAAETGAPFPIVSDFNREATRAFDVMYDDYWGLHGVAKRAAFVVDREGVVRYAWVSEDDAVQPELEAIRTVLEELEASTK